MKGKVYTRTGDAGTTSLVSGNRVSKDDVRVEAYGTVDELNSNIGVLLHSTKLDEHDIIALLRKAQNKLFNIAETRGYHRTGADDGQDERGTATHARFHPAWRLTPLGNR